MAHHFIISLQVEEIQQFKNGLASNGVLDILKKYPDNSRAFFTYNENCITPQAVKSIFIPHFSINLGKVTMEEDILFNWHHFIDEVGEQKNEKVQTFSLNDIEDGVTDESVRKTRNISLKDIVMFLTGSFFLPVPSPEVNVFFDHTTSGRVTVATCDMRLTFPVIERYSGDNFSSNITEDIINGAGYGRV